jgi:hypothetical protein
MREGAKVDDEDGVAVRVEVPRLIPALPELQVGARSGLQVDGG